MTVYLIHFDRPYTSPNGKKTVRHYLGSTDDLPARLARHKAGNGARLMEVITAAGIPWHLDRIWAEGGRELERRLKRYHKAAQLCTACREERIRRQWAEKHERGGGHHGGD